MVTNTFLIQTKAKLVLATALSFVASSSALAGSQPLSVRSSLTWYTVGTAQEQVNDSPLNPNNSVLEIESQIGAIDIRPNLKADSGQFQLVARPQFKMLATKSTVNDKLSTERPKSSAHWIEAYGNLTASDKVQVSYGLQNYQWGAAESFNPSNRIFHETIDGKGLLYTVEGRSIARSNLSWTKNINTVLMSETEQVKDATEFRSEEVFQTRSLMKHEINWNSGADYFGVVFGAPEKGSQWVGEYFNLTLPEGLSIYADASHFKNSEAWYPVYETSPLAPAQTVQMRQSKLANKKVYTIAVGGFRYSFEGGSDLRFEYIANAAGWTMDESKMAMLALDPKNQLQLPDYKTNLKRILKPGLEYRGQKYGLASLRIPDALYTKDLVLYGRVLRSLTDFSTAYYGSLELGFWSASTFLVSAYMSSGAPDSELRGVISTSLTAGLRQDF